MQMDMKNFPGNNLNSNVKKNALTAEAQWRKAYLLVS
jgi:hypothetical protein